ncbi:MAG: prepilin peptidase [Chlorobium sp.]|nr:prepilin peptidase [Chlorobium sp.]
MMEQYSIISILFIIYSVVLSFLDLRRGVIPRPLQMWGALLFLFLQFFLDRGTFFHSALAGAVLGLLIFTLVALIARKKLGIADVWYAAGIGIVLGPFRWYGAVFCACGLALATFFITRQKRLPFIPFMAAGAIPWLFFPEFHI